MALINFPPSLPLSLYLPLKVWSQPASGADKAGGLSSLAASPLTHPHAPQLQKRGSFHTRSLVDAIKNSTRTHKDVLTEQESTQF